MILVELLGPRELEVAENFPAAPSPSTQTHLLFASARSSLLCYFVLRCPEKVTDRAHRKVGPKTIEDILGQLSEVSVKLEALEHCENAMVSVESPYLRYETYLKPLGILKEEPEFDQKEKLGRCF